MSWGYGAVHEKGLILKEQDFKELLKLSESIKKENELTDEEIDDMFGGDLQDYAYDLGMYPVYVTICDINKIVGFSQSGESNYDLVETIEDDNIYVMWLKKDNLLNSYSGLDEMIEEIEKSIEDYFEIDIETVYKKLGKSFITDRFGLATGFYSDR